MENYNYKTKSILLKGRVCYENGSPVPSAKVMLEAFFPNNQDRSEAKYSTKDCGYTFSNHNGEFCCLIYNTKCYYKIKVIKNMVFNEESNYIDNENYNIYLG